MALENPFGREHYKLIRGRFCLEEITIFEDQRDKHNNVIETDNPILVTELTMKEDGQINIYQLRTNPTTDHLKTQINPNYGSEEPLHYATHIRTNYNDRIVVDHSEYYGKAKDAKITRQEVVGALRNHFNLVNQIRTDGGSKTIDRIDSHL